jgi:hypothetical protein
VRNLANFYKSNRKEVKKAMDGAKKNMLEALGKAGEAHVKFVTPTKTGALKNSIDYKVDDNSVYIGSTLTSEIYPIVVEKKTKPYIHPGIMGNLQNLREVAKKGYKL